MQTLSVSKVEVNGSGKESPVKSNNEKTQVMSVAMPEGPHDISLLEIKLKEVLHLQYVSGLKLV